MSTKISGAVLTCLRSLWTGQSCHRAQKLLTRRNVQFHPFCMPVRHHNFDGEAYNKTNMSLLTEEDESHTYLSAFSPYGFVLNSGFRILGPAVIFPRAVLSWNVSTAENITPESLSLFCMLEPKPDLLIIGKGDWDATVSKDIIPYLRSRKINVEILPTEQACSTFNFLNSERRVVVAGLIPPTSVTEEEDFVIGEGPAIASEIDLRETEMEVNVRKTVDQLSLSNLKNFREEGRKRSQPGFQEKEEVYNIDKDKKS